MAEDRWVRRYRFHVDLIPALLIQARSDLVPLGAVKSDAVRVSGSKEAPLPFREEAMQDADQLWALLVLYAREVAEGLGGSSPRVLRDRSWVTRGEVEGVPAGIGVGELGARAREVCRWLTARAESIGPLEHLQDSEDQLFALVRGLRVKYGLVARVPAVEGWSCRVCGNPAHRTDWRQQGATLVTMTTCKRCGDKVVVEEEVSRRVADVLASG